MFRLGNRELEAGTGSIIVGDRRIFNPTAELLREQGWEEFTPPPPPPPIKRYSKLKLIRALGDLWPEYKQMIEMAGFADEFWAANELAEDDPAFSQFLTLVPEDVKSILDSCLIDSMTPKEEEEEEPEEIPPEEMVEEPTEDSVLSNISSNDDKYDDTAEDSAKDDSESGL